MKTIDFDVIESLFTNAHGDGRARLYEHECYRLLAATGAEAAPANRLIGSAEHPTAADLEALDADRVVLKVVSSDITHKTEARGVRVVAREIGAVEAAFDLMLREVPESYAEYLEAHTGELPLELSGLRAEGLRRRLFDRIAGILLCSYVEPDARGFATELYVGIRATGEFGPIISAGLGGVEMETLARRTRHGSAVAIASTGTVNGEQFLELFRHTLSYQRLTGAMRGSRRLVEDVILSECFQAFIDLANHFSENAPEARFHIEEMEVNPFILAGGRLAPLDGVCSFRPASPLPEPRPVELIGKLLRPASLAVIGVSESSMNMGRIILNNIIDAGFDRSEAWVVRQGVEKIDGVRCVPSIADLPEKVDLFVVALGAQLVPGIVGELIDHDRARAVILIPGGLGEKEGSQELETDLKNRIANAHRRGDGSPIFLGGNSLGVVSHPGNYDTLFIPLSKLAASRGERPRKVAFLSQSGAFIISNQSRLPWLDPAYALSIGNQIDLTVSDLLGYISSDSDVEVFAVYMEGFRRGDGVAFADAVRRTTADGKDVVFYKAGRTSEGRSATAGHTASVAGDYAVCESTLEQAGAMIAADFSEFSDLLNLCVHLRGKQIRGNRLVAMSNAGYESVGMADSIRRERSHLELPSFGLDTADALQASLAEFRLDGLVDVKNPFDVTPMASDAAYCRFAAHILDDPSVDVMVAGLVPLTPAMQTLAPGEGHHESIMSEDSIARMLPALAAHSSTPLVAVVDSGDLFDPFADQLERGDLPVFRSADRAVRVLCKWVDVKLKNNP